MNIEDYRAVRISDCVNSNISYGIIMLNNKHTIKEFQEVIYNIKIRYFNEGNLDWQVDDILADKELEQYDRYKLTRDCDEYVEV